MGVAGMTGKVGLGLGIAYLALSSTAFAQSSPSTLQGAWLAQGSSCAEVYASAGTRPSFKRPVDIFAPAFIVSGNSLRTPMASCRIRSVRPVGNRHSVHLSCANAVAGSDVRVLMSLAPDGSLKRYFNEQDTIGTSYQRCMR
jgi:hypothetical protein